MSAGGRELLVSLRRETLGGGGGAAVASGASFIVPSTNRSHVKSGLVQKLNVPKKTTPRNNGDEEPPRGSKKSRRLIRR